MVKVARFLEVDRPGWGDMAQRRCCLDISVKVLAYISFLKCFWLKGAFRR